MVSFILLFSSLFNGVIGCNLKTTESKTWESGEVYKYTFNNIGQDDFVIGAFSGPNGAKSSGGVNYPSIITNDSFKYLKEAGVNTVFGIENWVVEDMAKITKTLNFADANDLNYVIYDTKVFYDNHVAQNRQEIADRLAEYESHSSFAGFYCKDEPVVSYFTMMKKAEDLINSLYPDGSKVCYSNMLPLVDNNFIYTNDANNLIDYKTYIEQYFSVVQPKYISYDMYPFGRTVGTVLKDWFNNLAIISSQANKNKVPFWLCIQTGGMWENKINRLPSETEFNWNINTALCFGAKGITFFPGVHSFYHVENEKGNEGLLDLQGEKTNYWYYANRLAPHLNLIDDVLTNCSFKGLVQAGKTPQKMPTENVTIRSTFRELKKASGDLLIGCFDYNGKTTLYVVNNNLKSNTTAELTFDANYKYSVVKRGVESTEKGSVLTLSLKGGEGVLITLK